MTGPVQKQGEFTDSSKTVYWAPGYSALAFWVGTLHWKRLRPNNFGSEYYHDPRTSWNFSDLMGVLEMQNVLVARAKACWGP